MPPVGPLTPQTRRLPGLHPNEALPQTDEGCGACGWFVSFLVGLRQGLVKLEIFLEATLA